MVPIRLVRIYKPNLMQKTACQNFESFLRKLRKTAKIRFLEKKPGGQSFEPTTCGNSLSTVKLSKEHVKNARLNFLPISSKTKKPPCKTVRKISKLEKLNFGPLTLDGAS